VRVYNSFDDLINHNKSLFKRILEDGHIELMRACWSARDLEVRQLEKRLILKDKELELSNGKERGFTNELDELKAEHGSICDSKNKMEQELASIKSEKDDVIKNCQSLEKFNKELLDTNSSLQDDITKYEKLNELKEAEYAELHQMMEREKLETSIELKNAKEAISYANELEDLQQKNIKYTEDLEGKNGKLIVDLERLKKSYHVTESEKRQVEQDLKNANQKVANEVISYKNLNSRYQEATKSINKFKKELAISRESHQSARSSCEQKKQNLNQLRATLDIKIKLLETRDSEVQTLSNKTKHYEQAINDLRQEIDLMEKVILELETNQTNLEEYSEKLKVTTEREIIRRKEAEVKYEKIRTSTAQILNDKENLEAKFNSVKKTLLNIQSQVSPKVSSLKPHNQHLQMDN